MITFCINENIKLIYENTFRKSRRLQYSTANSYVCCTSHSWQEYYLYKQNTSITLDRLSDSIICPTLKLTSGYAPRGNRFSILVLERKIKENVCVNGGGEVIYSRCNFSWECLDSLPPFEIVINPPWTHKKLRCKGKPYRFMPKSVILYIIGFLADEHIFLGFVTYDSLNNTIDKIYFPKCVNVPTNNMAGLSLHCVHFGSINR